jgi:transcription-repair coupling factor (superfamily II helicase)
VTAARAANSPLAQAGKMKPMRDMLFITFSEKLHAAPSESGKGINVGALMKLVSRNAKNGAQLTPQGVLRWPLSDSNADTVLSETRELLAQLEDAKSPV